MTNHGGGGWWKWLLFLIFAGALAGAGYWYFHSREGEGPDYQTETVTRADITEAVTATGQLNPVVNVLVGSQISGRIEKILVDYNSQVKSNQVIAQIDPSTYQSELLKANADLANANANLNLAQVQSRRAEALFTNQLISASDHDTAIAQAEQAAAQVKSALAEVENAKVDLSRCTIYAPVDGVVISRNVDVGQTVAASFNTPTLFEIANDLTRMQIDALVSEADIGGVAVGQTAKFGVDAFPYRTFYGQVQQIRYGAITNQNVVNYDCVIAVSNKDLKLLPGMTANLSIIIAARTNALRVPNAALRFRPPEVIAAETNALAQAASEPGASASEGRGSGRGGGGSRGGASGEAGGRGQRSGAGGGEAHGAKAGGKKHAGPNNVRTVYVIEDPNAKEPKLKPVKIHIGITDGAFTEVTDGLNEGDQVVTALLAISSQSGRRGSSNPFSGGFHHHY
ncbi:MAG TPA: efflux RND transporter periplasmic adaptor subunit [Verrucomicrobiae bacterium]|nr:efflux RND transporter periplasmic adaptor subunit [Verrucomicrobiae bacterium]